MIKETLFLKFNSIKPISLEFKEYLTKKLIILDIQEGAQLVQMPEVSQIAYFIAAGVVSGSRIINRKKQTYRFAGSGKFIIPTIYGQTTAYTEIFEIRSPTILIGLGIHHAKEAMTLFEEAEPIFLQIRGEEHNEFIERELFLRLPFKERFNKFYASKQLSYGNSNVNELASYFNISARTFQREKNGW